MTDLSIKSGSLKEMVDHVIVFPHFGTELVDIPDPADVKNSRQMIEAGASAVIGHHPHIIQGIENYLGGVIAYSLGSFIYIPEDETGFRSGHGANRDFSICLNLAFGKDRLEWVQPHYYKYDSNIGIPRALNEKVPYFDYVNKAIDNQTEYYKKIRQILFKREMISFYQRFKNAPFSTLIHYIRYLKPVHLKKMFS
jgi:hypothetical protein